jgi:hypothetical protein
MRVPELLSDPVYHDEDAARAYVESVRWPDGPFCPRAVQRSQLKLHLNSASSPARAAA